MKTKEEFFHSLLIDLHTYRWLGSEKFVKLLDAIGAYSYAYTNGNEWDEEDKWDKAYEQLVKTHKEL